MIKKTLYFGNPAYLSLRQEQLVIKMPGQVAEGVEMLEWEKKELEVTKPIEDIGIVILDNRRITITQGLLSALIANNTALITCDERSMPIGLQLPLTGNTVQSERFSDQISASAPLKKQLWQQTIKQKIENQRAVLSSVTDMETACMHRWAEEVKSGDSSNQEGRAAAFYWRNIFAGQPGLEDFTRGREEEPPNNLLNYGYAILRAIVARALVSTGLLPTLGIFHHNRYNAYCLADDIMEPYRPYVDKRVFSIVAEQGKEGIKELTKDLKAKLLEIPTLDVVISGKRSPLMVAVSQTTASLYKCYSGELRKIAYPEM